MKTMKTKHINQPQQNIRGRRQNNGIWHQQQGAMAMALE
jgi:hypothetical protein